MDVRLATLEDGEGIRAIYNREVLEGTATFDLRPRSAEDQRRWLTERSGAHAVMVAVEGDEVLGFAMIETAQALDNLDAILSVEGLDAVYVGPSDLSLALGCKPSFDDVEPPVAQAIEHILERARAHGLVAGIHNGSAATARARVARGFRFVTVSSDARLLAAGSQQILAQMRAD